MIDKLVDLERTREKNLLTWKKEWQEKSTQFSKLNTLMANVKTTLQTIDTPGEFLTKTVSSTLSTALSATADSTASTGTHSISIGQLAQNEVLMSQAVQSNASTDITGGVDRVFNFTYSTASGSASYSIFVGAGTTLNMLAQDINNNPSSNGQVQASVLKVSNNEYRLQLTSQNTGADYTISIDSSSTVPGYASNGAFSVAQSAQDSLLRVDGYPPTGWISRSTNKVNDIVQGLTLNLTAVTGSNASITLNTSVNIDQVKQNIQTLVDQINSIRSQIQSITKVSTDSGNTEASILTGNYGVEIISSNLENICSASATAFDSSKDLYCNLSQIGITTDATQGSSTYGLLVIDDNVLDAALSSNASAVGSLFSSYYDGATSSASFSYQSLVSGTTQAGAYSVAYTISNGSVVNATINGHPASYDSKTRQITASTKGTPEYGLVISVNNLNNGSYNGTVRLKLGKTGELVNSLKQLTDASSGPLVILQQNYGTIMSDIDEKISSEETRIKNFESNLRDRYSKLDALLGTYQSVQQQLSSTISSLKSSSS